MPGAMTVADPLPAGDLSQGVDFAKDNWAAYRPVLDLARHPNIMMKISDVHNRSAMGFPHHDMKGCVQLAVGCFGKGSCLLVTCSCAASHSDNIAKPLPVCPPLVSGWGCLRKSV